MKLFVLCISLLVTSNSCVGSFPNTDIDGGASRDAAAAKTTPMQVSALSNSEIDEDHDGVPAEMDCDDHNPNTYPGAPEICDYEDNDCNGRTDEPWSEGPLGALYRKPCISMSYPESQCISAGIWGCDMARSVLVCNAQPQLPTAYEICNGIDDECSEQDLRDPGPALHSPCTVGIGSCARTGTVECNIYSHNPYCTAQDVLPAACTETADSAHADTP